ncbi:MAG: hypothetical protein KKE73_15520 [Proteobacteria bacterium]|nr:hypothetical protein [Pseudomonadota bacterium]
MLSRREFFQKILLPQQGAEQGRSPAAAPSEDFGSLAGDLPPELLDEEARRLGLDPATAGRAEIIAAVSRAMLARGPTQQDEPPDDK